MKNIFLFLTEKYRVNTEILYDIKAYNHVELQASIHIDFFPTNLVDHLYREKRTGF